MIRMADEGRGVAAISLGEALSNLRSEDFRMGQPNVVNRRCPPNFLDKRGFFWSTKLQSKKLGGREPGEVKHLSNRRKRKKVIPLLRCSAVAL